MNERTKLQPGQRTCPKCGSDWDGGSILETFIKQREEGYSVWKGMTDEQIKRSIEGWTEEEILTYIDSITDFDIPALVRYGYTDGDPKAFVLNLPVDKRNRYLSWSHDTHVTGSYSPPYRWGREIGIELPYDHPNHYDGISYWQCPDCNTAFDRFTGKEGAPSLHIPYN